MSAGNCASLALAAAMVVYLVYTLLRPERF